jgi:hypothetical protein
MWDTLQLFLDFLNYCGLILWRWMHYRALLSNSKQDNDDLSNPVTLIAFNCGNWVHVRQNIGNLWWWNECPDSVCWLWVLKKVCGWQHYMKNRTTSASNPVLWLGDSWCGFNGVLKIVNCGKIMFPNLVISKTKHWRNCGSSGVWWLRVDEMAEYRLLAHGLT